MLRINRFKINKSYNVWLEFSDGIKGTVCLKYLVGKGVFKLWEDYNFFKQATTDPVTGALMWQGGNNIVIDLDTYKLHDDVAS